MKHVCSRICLAVLALSFWTSGSVADDFSQQIKTALDRAGENRQQLQSALDQTPAAERAGMEFLIAFMPEHDLRTLSAEFLLTHVRLAYQAWRESPWKDAVPNEIFLNHVLPYASINESREPWREDFLKRCRPLVKDAASPAAAAAVLNRELFPLLKVRYSTERKRADQAPSESIKTGLASCTGLAILLIDACRAVGVPARFVGTPLWTNKSGNHSWVEIWDDGWHFTGAAEPTGDQLDQAWFVGRAAAAQRDHPLHAIYAVSYQRTPQTFPLVWDPTIDYVFAVNVTDRYTRRGEKLPAGHVEVMFRAIQRGTGKRRAVPLKVIDAAKNVVFTGQTKDERFDANDHLSCALRDGQQYQVEIGCGDRAVVETIKAQRRAEPVTFQLDVPGPADATAEKAVDENASRAAAEALTAYVSDGDAKRKPLGEQGFAQVRLTRDDVVRCTQLLWQDHVQTVRRTRAMEMEARELADGELKMPFFYKVFGDKPKTGRSMYISLHGGGGAPKQVNDKQWENQKRLYKLEEGVYVVPRAPTNTWNLWHQQHIDRLFDRLIENMIVLEDVNPDRVYLLGYSAGGDGVYQLAPRMADRFAAAAMMAGHPNETSPLGLRNIAFTIHVGGRDSAYNRNGVARDWQKKLAELHAADPEGYVHLVKIYPDKGHWLDREDAAAIAWMAKHRRDPWPQRIVWKQDDVVRDRFYWLAVKREDVQGRPVVTASREGQQIQVQTDDLRRLNIRLNDDMLDLDRPIHVLANGHCVFHGLAPRTIAVLAQTLQERGDPRSVFCAELGIKLPTADEPAP